MPDEEACSQLVKSCLHIHLCVCVCVCVCEYISHEPAVNWWHNFMSHDVIHIDIHVLRCTSGKVWNVLSVVKAANWS